jgi:copper chaperone NosL
MTSGPAPSRRGVVRTLGVGAVAGLAGCLDALDSGSDSGPPPEPVDLSGTKFDYEGGMEIGRHGGPNGQVFYANNEPETPHDSGESPEARDDLAWFHTLAFGLFPYHLERLDRGWEAEAVYVTDYSAFDWDLTEREGSQQLPAPTAPDTFADATGLTYVAESGVMGGMGSELVPFSEDADAQAFRDDHGGQLLSFDDIDRRLVDSLQGM